MNEGASCVFASDWISYALHRVGVKGAASPVDRAKLEAIREHYRTVHRASWRSIRRAAKAVRLDRRH